MGTKSINLFVFPRPAGEIAKNGSEARGATGDEEPKREREHEKDDEGQIDGGQCDRATYLGNYGCRRGGWG